MQDQQVVIVTDQSVHIDPNATAKVYVNLGSTVDQTVVLPKGKLGMEYTIIRHNNGKEMNLTTRGTDRLYAQGALQDAESYVSPVSSAGGGSVTVVCLEEGQGNERSTWIVSNYSDAIGIGP